MRELLADWKLAMRLYSQTPASALVVVVILAVGTCFVGACLSLYADLALKPFPGVLRDGRRVSISISDGNTSGYGLTSHLLEGLTTLDAFAGIHFRENIPIGTDDQRLAVESVSPGFTDVIRPKLALGRSFESSDHNRYAEPVGLISYRYWRERYDGRPDAIGKTIVLNLESYDDGRIEVRIVGVMAPEMRGISDDGIELWVPFEQILSVTSGRGADYEQARAETYMLYFGRRRSGTTTKALINEIKARFRNSTGENNWTDGSRVKVVHGIVRKMNVYREAERQLRLLLAASIVVALVAAANVALFLLARAPSRQRELAIRMSLGATTKRLVRQLVSEAGLLVAGGALVGLPVSVWLAGFLRGLVFLRSAKWTNVSLFDWRVLSLVGLFLLSLTLLASLAPILGLRRLGLTASSRLTAARATLAQQLVGTAQLAVAGLLGGAAIAFVWFLAPIVMGDPGYQIENRQAPVLFPKGIFDQSPNQAPKPGSKQWKDERAKRFQRALVDTARQREVIEAVPGVRAVTFTSAVPGRGAFLPRRIRDPRDPSREIAISIPRIDSRSVDVLGLKVLYGRAPKEKEIGASLVNRAFARRFFGRDDVVGEHVSIVGPGARSTEITGVLEDLSFGHPAATVEPMLFTNLPQTSVVSAVVETAFSSAELQRQLQSRLDSGELDVQSIAIKSLRQLRDLAIAPDKARGWLTIVAASLGILMAAFGFHSIQYYVVSRGRREFAIRAALGAGPRSLFRLVLRRGLMLAIPGMALGALLAFITVAWLRDAFLSREISPGIVTAVAVTGMACLTLAASLWPARRVRRTQSAVLLRDDA